MGVEDLDQFEVTFFGPFKNGMKWNSPELLDPKKGLFHVVEITKTSVHLIPVGGSQRDKFSVPKNKVKMPFRRVVE